jgi:hypothetical protein
MNKTSLSILLLATMFSFRALAQEATVSPGPDHSAHPEHAQGVDERGDKGMGFNHQLTGHHFYLFPDGGGIEVEARDSKDAKSQDAIRTHMSMIAAMFAEGNFSIPMFVHNTVPPGVEKLKLLKKEITYTAENTPLGAQVRITTKNSEAIKAIHEFLRFQIEEHRTGDSMEVKK